MLTILLILLFVFTVSSAVVLRVLFHPKQLQLYSGSDDGEVRIWDLVDKSCVAVLKVGTMVVRWQA